MLSGRIERCILVLTRNDWVKQSGIKLIRTSIHLRALCPPKGARFTTASRQVQ
jgi:hypothetical protein